MIAAQRALGEIGLDASRAVGGGSSILAGQALLAVSMSIAALSPVNDAEARHDLPGNDIPLAIVAAVGGPDAERFGQDRRRQNVARGAVRGNPAIDHDEEPIAKRPARLRLCSVTITPTPAAARSRSNAII